MTKARGKETKSVPMLVELAAELEGVNSRTHYSLIVRGTVSNVGPVPLDTRLAQSELLVNSEPSLVWSLAIGNGPRDPREYRLEPAGSLTFARVLGGGLLQGPGDYELILRVRGVESNRVRVHVS
jgi:hypothetical protein